MEQTNSQRVHHLRERQSGGRESVRRWASRPANEWEAVVETSYRRSQGDDLEVVAAGGAAEAGSPADSRKRRPVGQDGGRRRRVCSK
uniref:DUF834 domain-containing protein n=1 Tax=Oryza glumipatula TaxID=40148 RepID=A0A0E0B937_9ORYZ